MKAVWIYVIIGLAASGLLIAIFFSKPMELTIPDDDDVEALGRMIASENPRDILIVQQAIAWTAINNAKLSNKSVARLLMPNGQPAPQAGRYASTVNPSTAATRAVAYDCLSGKVQDPTGGAIQFDAPRTQDILYQQGKYKQNADDIYASRTSEGKVPFYLPGVDPYYMRWWKYA